MTNWQVVVEEPPDVPGTPRMAANFYRGGLLVARVRPSEHPARLVIVSSMLDFQHPLVSRPDGDGGVVFLQTELAEGGEAYFPNLPEHLKTPWMALDIRESGET